MQGCWRKTLTRRRFMQRCGARRYLISSSFHEPCMRRWMRSLAWPERVQAAREATLYSTTYPCHGCAKHIVAAGISEVVYYEPYPKSRALALHDDSIQEDTRAEYTPEPPCTSGSSPGWPHDDSPRFSRNGEI